MQQKSLGLIETQGLAAGVEAADAAVKSANVELVGYELTRGGGWVTIKILGNVGAVKAAVDAARIAAEKVNHVVSSRVIARPSDSLEMLIHSENNVGTEPPPPGGPDSTPPEHPGKTEKTDLPVSEELREKPEVATKQPDKVEHPEPVATIEEPEKPDKPVAESIKTPSAVESAEPMEVPQKLKEEPLKVPAAAESAEPTKAPQKPKEAPPEKPVKATEKKPRPAKRQGKKAQKRKEELQ